MLSPILLLVLVYFIGDGPEDD